MEENTNENVNQNEGQETNQEPEKKLGKRLVGWILIGALFVFAMSVIFFRGINIKDTRNDSENISTPNSVQTERQEEPKNTVDDKSEFNQNLSTSDGSDSSRGNNSNVAGKEVSGLSEEKDESEVASTNKQPRQGTSSDDTEEELNTEEPIKNVIASSNTDDSISQVDSPSLGNSAKGTALVLNKCSYLFKSSYVYCVEVVIVVDGGESHTVQYMCPLRSYEAVEVGTTVNVEYQMDENNVISIYSLSK